jgi:hypothetical protein
MLSLTSELWRFGRGGAFVLAFRGITPFYYWRLARRRCVAQRDRQYPCAVSASPEGFGETSVTRARSGGREGGRVALEPLVQVAQ